MTNLQAILKTYSDSSRMLGEDESNQSNFNKQEFVKSLQNLSKKNNAYFWVLTILAAFAFIVSCIVVLRYSNDPTKITLIFGATGISISGILAFMNKIWKEKLSTDMILSLAGVVKEENLNSIIVALLAKI